MRGRAAGGGACLRHGGSGASQHIHQLYETPRSLADAVAHACLSQADTVVGGALVLDVGVGRGRLIEAVRRHLEGGDHPPHHVTGIEVQTPSQLGSTAMEGVEYGCDIFDSTRRWPGARRGVDVVVLSNPPFRIQLDVLNAVVERAVTEGWSTLHIFAILGASARTPSARSRTHAHLHLCAEWALPRPLCTFDHEGHPVEVCAVLQHLCMRRDAAHRLTPPLTLTPRAEDAQRVLRRLGGDVYRLARDQHAAPLYVKRVGSHVRVGDCALVPAEAQLVDDRVVLSAHRGERVRSVGTVHTKLGTAMGIEPCDGDVLGLRALFEDVRPHLTHALAHRSTSFSCISLPSVILQLLLKRSYLERAGGPPDAELDALCAALGAPLPSLTYDPAQRFRA